jgi:hypothetical protein
VSGLKDRCFDRIRIIFPPKCKSFLFFKIVQLKVVYPSQINHIHCRRLITELVGIKMKCYLSFIFVRSNFISFLDINAFQRLRMIIFTVQNIWKLYVQISLLDSKTHPPSSCAGSFWKISNLWFNVSYNPYKRSLLYPLCTRILEEI